METSMRSGAKAYRCGKLLCKSANNIALCRKQTGVKVQKAYETVSIYTRDVSTMISKSFFHESDWKLEASCPTFDSFLHSKRLTRNERRHCF